MSLGRSREVLIRLFTDVHELQRDPVVHRTLALTIQEELIRRITHCERAIRETRTKVRAIKVALARRGNTRERAQALKKGRAALEARLSYHKELLDIFRTIGDSVAFIYGDRFDIKQLSLREPAGFISAKEGSRTERLMLRQVFAKGYIGILNDLTHSLRFGDVTMFLAAELSPHSPFNVIEVKSGSLNSRARRQMKAMEDTMTYLRTDTKIIGDITFLRDSTQREPTGHGGEFVRLVGRMNENGWAQAQVEPGLEYLVISAEKEPSLDEILSPTPTLNSKCVLCFNDAKYVHAGYYPFPLSLSDADVLFRFYDAQFVGLAVVDMQQVNSALRSRGLSVALAKDDEFPWLVTAVDTKVPIKWKVGSHLLGRLAAEFLSLDWLIENIASLAAVTQTRLQQPVSGDDSPAR